MYRKKVFQPYQDEALFIRVADPDTGFWSDPGLYFEKGQIRIHILKKVESGSGSELEKPDTDPTLEKKQVLVPSVKERPGSQRNRVRFSRNFCIYPDPEPANTSSIHNHAREAAKKLFF